MAVQTTEEFLSAGSTSYATNIEKLKDTDLKVTIGGAPQTYVTSSPSTGQYTVTNNPTTIVLGAAASGEVHIYRETDIETPAAVFVAGSSIRANDLNAIHDMARFAAVEHRNNIITADIKDGQITSAKILDGTIVDTDISATANINGSKLANDSVNLDKLGSGNLPSDIQIDANNIASGGFDSRYYTETELDAGQLDNRYYTETELTSGGVLDSKYYTETELDAGQLDNRYFTETELNNGQLDNRYYTETELATDGILDSRYLSQSAADARYFNISTGDTIKDGDAFPDNDTTIATTAAINDRIVDLIDDVGGFVPIANETSFPNANPDVNNGTGTLVSVPLANNITSDGSGIISITNGTVGNSTVTITGATPSSTFTQGFGIIVETTSTLNTYTFHRYVPKATEVTTVASKATEIGLLGTPDAVEDLSILGTTDVVADMAVLATTDVVADLNTLGTADVVADMNTLAVPSVVNNLDTVATNVSNVNNVGGSIANVNIVGNNIGTVNDFAARYNSGASNPTTNLNTGDLFFNTTDNELKIYNGTSWQGGVTAQGSLYTNTSVDTHLNQANPTIGHVLSWNGSDYAWVSNAGFTNTDVDTHLNQNNPTSGHVLSWNGSDYAWVDNAGYTDANVNTHLNQNTATSNQVMSWNGSDYAWINQSSGLVGSSNEKLFVEAENAMDNNFTTTAGNNYVSASPLTLNATLTVTSGSTMSFV